MSRRISDKTESPSRGGHKTRHRILAAALRLFSRNGFHGTSIRSLARSVGITEASIYYHFPSKRAIVEAIYERRGFMSALDELDRLSGDMPLDRQLVANARASARLWDENADLLRVVIVEVLRGDRSASAAHRELMERWRRGIHELLSRYWSRGDIESSIDIAEAADSWVSMMFGLFMDRLLALGRASLRSSFLTQDFRRQVDAQARRFAQRISR